MSSYKGNGQERGVCEACDYGPRSTGARAVRALRQLEEAGWDVCPAPCSDTAEPRTEDKPWCRLRPFGGPEWREEPFDDDGRSTGFYAQIEGGPPRDVIAAFEENGLLLVESGQLGPWEVAIFMSATLSHRVLKGELAKEEAADIVWPRTAAAR
jgi:hypothetical protein